MQAIAHAQSHSQCTHTHTRTTTHKRTHVHSRAHTHTYTHTHNAGSGFAAHVREALMAQQGPEQANLQRASQRARKQQQQGAAAGPAAGLEAAGTARAPGLAIELSVARNQPHPAAAAGATAAAAGAVAAAAAAAGTAETAGTAAARAKITTHGGATKAGSRRGKAVGGGCVAEAVNQLTASPCPAPPHTSAGAPTLPGKQWPTLPG